MLKNWFRARNFLYSVLYPMGRKCVLEISKTLALCERELVKTTLVPLKSGFDRIQLPEKYLSLRGISTASCNRKKDCLKMHNKIKNKEKAKRKKQREKNCALSKLGKSPDEDEIKEIPINENPCKGKGNLVAVLYKSEDLRLEEREKPKPGPGEIVIAMNCVGLSSTDVNYYTKGQLATPIVLGREGTGIVAVLGQGVINFREGDRVVIQPNVHCGQCEFCKNCQYHLCSCPKLCGKIPHDGLLTCYYTHAAEYCHKLPQRITMEEGVLMNMLANGIQACSRCPMCVGASVLIIGAGTNGLLSLIASKAMGATNTCVICKHPERLQLAKQFDAKTVQICDNALPEDIAQSVHEEMGGAPKITIDSVGSETSMKLAIASATSGGSIVLTSVSDEVHAIPLGEVAHRDITIRGALRHSNKFPAAIALASTGSVNLKPLISHHFYLEQISDAFDTVIKNEESVNKVVVHIRPRDRNNANPF